MPSRTEHSGHDFQWPSLERRLRFNAAPHTLQGAFRAVVPGLCVRVLPERLAGASAASSIAPAISSLSVTEPCAKRTWILSPEIETTFPVPHAGLLRCRRKSPSLNMAAPCGMLRENPSVSQ